MSIEIHIINIINDKLKNPIYKTMQLLNLKTILAKSNFTKKEGVAVHMVVLHFVYMLVMNKKMSTFMKQSNDSLKKDVYYRLLANSSYNWRSLLTLSVAKILSKLHKLKQKKNSSPIDSIDLEINDEKIIETYKRRWDIEQGYKELRQHFGFGQEENRIYEALIARITLFFSATSTGLAMNLKPLEGYLKI